ncbi:hypothetical protein KIPB_004610 [Kipferlia bialata]|uniref:Uncharacterized protein n=1 Tax=Kipferlia bialata TaxID=797122 RepID=A0A9K3GHX5_9EUKA|nr:hypothetical protein KIPB_004610 [Kipferlia bialata]|eukprot:g4610.t1
MCTYGGEAYLFGCFGGMVHILSLDTHEWRSIQVLEWKGPKRSRGKTAVLDSFVIDDTIFLLVEHGGFPKTHAIKPDTLSVSPIDVDPPHVEPLQGSETDVEREYIYPADMGAQW